MLPCHYVNTMLLWKYTLFYKYKQRIFSTKPQCCLTFLWIEPQMLLKNCLLHINMILPRHYTLSICVYVYVSVFQLNNLFFIIIFVFIPINHIISIKQEHLFIWIFFSKVQPTGVAKILLNVCRFQPGVAYKCCLYKKSCKNVLTKLLCKKQPVRNKK